MTQLECPLCGLVVRLQTPDRKPGQTLDISYSCKCLRSIWLESRGWFLSFQFIKRVKDSFHSQNRQDHAHLLSLLSQLIPEEMKTAEIALDSTVVKLYCTNDACVEKGFITRTKASAEKLACFCGVCNSVMKW